MSMTLQPLPNTDTPNPDVPKPAAPTPPPLMATPDAHPGQRVQTSQGGRLAGRGVREWAGGASAAELALRLTRRFFQEPEEVLGSKLRGRRGEWLDTPAGRGAGLPRLEDTLRPGWPRPSASAVQSRGRCGRGVCGESGSQL